MIQHWRQCKCKNIFKVVWSWSGEIITALVVKRTGVLDGQVEERSRLNPAEECSRLDSVEECSRLAITECTRKEDYTKSMENPLDITVEDRRLGEFTRRLYRRVEDTTRFLDRHLEEDRHLEAFEERHLEEHATRLIERHLVEDTNLCLERHLEEDRNRKDIEERRGQLEAVEERHLGEDGNREPVEQRMCCLDRHWEYVEDSLSLKS